MFPALPQRLLIAAAFAVGLVGMLLVLPALKPGDLSSGISLVDDGSAAAMRAVGLLALAALPVVLAGIVVSTTGNPLSGVFAGAAVLMVLACRGGSITGWIFRHQVPGDYASLIGESLLDMLGIILLFRATQFCRPILEALLPPRLLHTHFGMPEAVKDGQPHPSAQRGLLLTIAIGPAQRTHTGKDIVDQLGALAVCTLVGGALSYLLLRSPQTGQVVCGLMLAFTVAGLISHLLFPRADALPILLAPLVAALVGYAWVLTSYPNNPDTLLAALYGGHLPGLAMALPLHFMSAGVAGAAVGIGWGQGFLASDEEAAQRRKAIAGSLGSRLPGWILALAEARRRQMQEQQKHDRDEQ